MKLTVLVENTSNCSLQAEHGLSLFIEHNHLNFLFDMGQKDLFKHNAELLQIPIKKVDFAINVEVPDENIVNRMSGRRACLGCGSTYHIKHAPTKVEGICDRCGKELILRDDDKPETVMKRLDVYHNQTQPLIDYYTNMNILKSVDGTQPMDKVFADIVAILGE